MLFRRNEMVAALAALTGIAVLTGCTTVVDPSVSSISENLAVATNNQRTASFEQDRQAILAMAGNYQVKFDFIETVSFMDGYAPKDRKISGGHEMVRVIEDTGDFISLQHTLVVGGEQKFVVKHWRQDWRYEPLQVLTFIGGNAWEVRPVSGTERAGNWSQTVYQVDDSPRYGAVGQWSHDNGISEWLPPAEWRPLPRRDMTTRDDYHAVDAVNRHAITPTGWVHEQDNSKLVLSEGQQLIVREIGVNTYTKVDDYDFEAGDSYWNATKDYWAGVRGMWAEFETPGSVFALTLAGEPQDLYSPLLGAAEAVQSGEMETDEALEIARANIQKYTTTDIARLEDRLRPTVGK